MRFARIEAHVFEDNLSSIRVLRRLGFVRDGAGQAGAADREGLHRLLGFSLNRRQWARAGNAVRRRA